MQHLNIKEYVAAEKEKLRQAAIEQDIHPYLGIIDGTSKQDAANQIYIRNKLKDFAAMGWDAKVFDVIEDTCHFAIDEAIDDGCTGLIVQLPLEQGIYFNPNHIPAMFDADGLRPDSRVNPATPQGIIDYLETCGFPFRGALAVVLGRSDIVGKPMARMLLEKDCTVCQCHSKSDTSDVSGLLMDADLVVSAVGRPHFICRGQCTNAIVIDVGINKLPDGRLLGDFEEDERFVNDNVWSSPVPGGVGLLTRLALMKNTFKLAGGKL